MHERFVKKTAVPMRFCLSGIRTGFPWQAMSLSLPKAVYLLEGVSKKLSSRACRTGRGLACFCPAKSRHLCAMPASFHSLYWQQRQPVGLVRGLFSCERNKREILLKNKEKRERIQNRMKGQLYAVLASPST